MSERNPWQAAAEAADRAGAAISTAAERLRHAGALERASAFHDPSETLALIAEHRLTVAPIPREAPVPASSRWMAYIEARGAGGLYAEGPTIGDAVRACVQRIKSAGDGRGTE